MEFIIKCKLIKITSKIFDNESGDNYNTVEIKNNNIKMSAYNQTKEYRKKAIKKWKNKKQCSKIKILAKSIFASNRKRHKGRFIKIANFIPITELQN